MVDKGLDVKEGIAALAQHESQKPVDITAIPRPSITNADIDHTLNQHGSQTPASIEVPTGKVDGLKVMWEKKIAEQKEVSAQEIKKR